MQLVKQEVVYLGQSISKAGRQIHTDRKQAISSAPKPETKKQMMQFLGLCNYCRAWVPDYASVTQPLLDMIHSTPMAMTDKVSWTQEGEQAFIQLKQLLTQSTTLLLPDYKKQFVQMVDCKEGFMVSVLLQLHGDRLKPLAFYSKRLDPVARALPPCVQAVCAAAVAVEASADVVLFHPLKLMVPHAVDILLLQSRLTSLSPARQITYTALLLSQPHITIHRCNVLNPATLLPLPTDGTPHDCVDLSEKLQLPRPDLQDTPLETGPTWFVDGSCSKAPNGKNLTGFAVVQLPDIVICAERLPGHFSAQAAEIIALTTAFRLGEGKEVTIYTDSQYAFSTLFYFAKQWEQRGMTTSTGKPVTHATLLKDLLHKIMLPSRLAVCKCAAHTGGKDLVSMGNHLANITAKAAAAGHHSHSHFLSHTDFEIDSDILSSAQEHAPQSEKQSWLNRGAIKTQFWVIKNKPILPRSLFHAAAISTHGPCHVSTGGMIDIIHKFFFTIGLEAYLKQNL
ncbi:uncharacterized protein LOC106512310 [Austrofundulus limnaeus]|uniref:Uncharacterized protein LOC106512310 n=1 Tax=Austrofundulus limnaeus TaxID=52670 RepID=A0A2I4ALR3_AUSLI|nr:PREDICTED: uncharacterized protein LOC106512310 [Austrofundulus limnaeus]